MRSLHFSSFESVYKKSSKTIFKLPPSPHAKIENNLQFLQQIPAIRIRTSACRPLGPRQRRCHSPHLRSKYSSEKRHLPKHLQRPHQLLSQLSHQTRHRSLQLKHINTKPRNQNSCQLDCLQHCTGQLGTPHNYHRSARQR